MFIGVLSLLSIHLFVGVSLASCECSSVVIPVHVNALVATDPTDVFSGLKSDSSSVRRVNDTYDIYGVFCQPNPTPAETADVLQLLAPGFSYTNQYWSPPIEEFRNYSYTEFSCERGVSSLAVDLLAVGLSSRPVNASDVQYTTAAAALSQLGHFLKTTSILPGVEPFKKVIGIGHSLGSGLFNVGAIVDGAQSPFAGLVLTSHLTFGRDDPPPGSGTGALPVPAREADPLRWGTLDPAYITIPTRDLFYPADPTTYSARMVQFDGFTADMGSVSGGVQAATSSISVGNYTGAVAKVVGSEDQVLCVASGRCADVAKLTTAESVVWTAAKSFELVVAQGSGHNMNLDFFARDVFGIIFAFVEKFSG